MTQVIYSLHNDSTQTQWLNRAAPVTLLMLLSVLYSSIYCLLAFHKPACVIFTCSLSFTHQCLIKITKLARTPHVMLYFSIQKAIVTSIQNKNQEYLVAQSLRSFGCSRKSRITQYHRIEACNYSIQNKNQEYLVVLMPNTVINPYTVVVLHRKSC